MEEDEAGRLRAFRQRFGRGWDAETAAEEGEEGGDGYVFFHSRVWVGIGLIVCV